MSEISREILSVGDLNRAIAASLEDRFDTVWVSGEISNFKAYDSGQTDNKKDSANGLQVNIDADAKAPHQAVMSALEAARDANLSNIVFSSQTKK